MERTIHPKILARPEFYIQQAATTFNATCNSHCLHCSGAVTGEAEMPIEKAKEVMNMILYEMRIKDIFIACSAELTLYSNLLELVRFCDKEYLPYTRITQDTNARLIPAGFIEALNSMRNWWTISISLWGGNSEEWQTYQGKGDWENQVRNIERYLTELKIPPAFSMPAITDEQRESTLAFIISEVEKCGLKWVIDTDPNSLSYKRYKELGIVPINIRKYRGYAGSNEDKEADENGTGYYIHSRESAGTVEENIYKDMNNCHFPYNSFFCDSSGYVYPCINENNNRESAIGNVNDYSPFNMKAYYEMMHSEKGIAFWKNNFIPGKFPCETCRNCPSRNAY